MKINAEKLKGKGPIIVSFISLSLLLVTIISLFFYSPSEIEGENGELIFGGGKGDEVIEEVDPKYYYGILADTINYEHKVVESGQSLSTMLSPYGLSATDIYNLTKKSKKVFNVRSIKQGATYSVLTSKEDNPKIRHFVYDINSVEYVMFSFGDSLEVKRGEKEIISSRKTLHVSIRSSLWESIIAAGGNAALVVGIEDIFQWTVDFYGVKEGDSFTFVYDENHVDGKLIGIGEILGVSYRQKGFSKYAFKYDNGKTKGYWDEKGMSLKRAFLKAPLKFSRISSKFTYRRLHPIHKVYKAHTGVDYAAPMGTPVLAMADGYVTRKFYNRGGGNTLFIQHPMLKSAYRTGYLHLKGFAKGIKKGSRVSQGQVIGYVGSTGASTGPHLDFRVWKHNKPIDPLKMGNERGEPLNKSEITKYKVATGGHFETIKAIEERAERELTDAKKLQIEERRKLQEEEEADNDLGGNEDHEI